MGVDAKKSPEEMRGGKVFNLESGGQGTRKALSGKFLYTNG